MISLQLFFYKYLQLKIALVEREDQAASGGKQRKKAGKVSAEALEGLLEADADDDNFGLEGEGFDDFDDEEEDEGDEFDEDMGEQRGTKRKSNATTGKEKQGKPNKKAKVNSKPKKKAKKIKISTNGPRKTKVAKRNKRIR